MGNSFPTHINNTILMGETSKIVYRVFRGGEGEEKKTLQKSVVISIMYFKRF